jgi:hypothetical protein
LAIGEGLGEHQEKWEKVREEELRKGEKSKRFAERKGEEYIIAQKRERRNFKRVGK